MPDQDDTLETNSIAGNSSNSPAGADTKMGADDKNTAANSPLIAATPAVPEGRPVDSQALDSGQFLGSPASDGKQAASQEADGANAAEPSASSQPNVYGGNFGNDVQGSYHDAARASNQRSDPNRGELGEKGSLGATHAGYGNQFRDFDTAAERPAAEPTEEKYYGDGAQRPGLQHNSYQNYDGQDQRPAEQGHAVHDTPTPRARNFDQPDNTPTDGRGNTHDNRNDVGRTDANAAFQNDNGAPTVGAAYADDYGHTSGVSLPAGTPDHHVAMGPNGHGEVEDERSSRGGYDNQGSQGGRSHDQQPGGEGTAGAPAPVNSPDAPQTEGYGYGHERSEEEKAARPKTGDSRNGFGPGGSKEGDTSQGHGSQGGSYDDENPGARGPEYDNFTQQEKAQNYGQDKREDFRPESGDKPEEGDYGPTPRRNAGRDES
jgi:hypothetical protein